MTKYRVILKSIADQIIEADGWSIDSTNGTIALFRNTDSEDGVLYVALFTMSSVIGVIKE